MNTESFVIERTFNASADVVWAALTDSEKMKEWYFDIPSFKPEVGFEFQFTAENKGLVFIHECRITELIPGKKLAHTWSYKNYPGNSVVSFELFPEGKKTRLKLTHAGLETFPQNNPDFARESFVAGWTYIVGTSLENYLEKTTKE